MYAIMSANYSSLFKQRDDEKDLRNKLEILQKMAECQVNCDRMFGPDLDQIIEVCGKLQYEPHAVSNSLAKQHLEKSSFILAYVMYVAASKMYRMNSRGCNVAAIKGISSCIHQLHKIGNKLLTKAVTRRIASIHVIPSMHEMLKQLQEVKELNRVSKVIMEATLLNRMGRVYQKVENDTSAHDQCDKALNIMQKGIGTDCKKYKVYGGLLHNIGIVCEMRKEYAQAVANYEQSIKAKEEAEDYDNPEKKERNIRFTNCAFESCKKKLSK